MNYTDFDEKIVLTFLERNYPVSRVKSNMRFKRAIILDNGTHFFLSEINSRNTLKMALLVTLNTVFSYDIRFLKRIVDTFFLNK
jgi:hypothetical protein